MAISVPKLKDEECKCECVGGCTNPYSPNYDPKADDDDGSCLTCENQGLCVVPDPDGGSGCNSVGNGCCDEWGYTTGKDDSPSFSRPFTAKNGRYYPSCYG
jgi:hypothetical protein